MKLPLDLETPFDIVLAVAGSTASTMLAAWQFLGSMLAQFPTPDKVSGWSERDIYLCALIIACATVAWMARWVVAEFLEVLSENAKSNAAVANALSAFTDKVDTLVVSTDRQNKWFEDFGKDALHTQLEHARHSVHRNQTEP